MAVRVVRRIGRCSCAIAFDVVLASSTSVYIFPSQYGARCATTLLKGKLNSLGED